MVASPYVGLYRYSLDRFMHRQDFNNRRPSRSRSSFDDMGDFGSRPSRPGRPDFGDPRPPSAPLGPEQDATVKWFNPEKGFGFVEMTDGSGDVFLHGNAVSRSGYASVNPGDVLRVRVGQGQKGRHVAEITGVTPGEAPPPRAGGGGFGGPRAGGGGFGGPRPPRPMGAGGPRRTPDASTAVEMRGTVKWFNEQKGFGFITPEDGTKDVFVHISAVTRSGLNQLREGDRVSAQVVQGGKGPEALSLSVI